MVGEITLMNSLIGLKFTQTLKVKPREIRLYTFSCASGSLLVFTSISYLLFLTFSLFSCASGSLLVFTSISYLLFLTFSRICSPVR